MWGGDQEDGVEFDLLDHFVEVGELGGILKVTLAEVGSLLFDDVAKGDDLGLSGIFEHGGGVPAVGHPAATDKSKLEHVVVLVNGISVD